MPTSRFVVVSAPIEEQLTASVATQLKEALSLALRLKRSVNATLHDDELGKKAGNALAHIIEPGGLPFCLFVALVTVLLVREALLHVETKRILRVHRAHGCVPDYGSKHEHDD